jgi:hypothetical protein
MDNMIDRINGEDEEKLQISAARLSANWSLLFEADESGVIIAIPLDYLDNEIFEIAIFELLSNKFRINDCEKIVEDICSRIKGDETEVGKYDISNNSSSLKRTILISNTSNNIDIQITGANVVHGKNAHVKEYFFTHEITPGKIKKDGAIDFAEMNKYPTITKDSALLTIIHEVHGTNGISCYGEKILAPQAQKYNLKTSGIIFVPLLDDDNNEIGDTLYAKRDGVITYLKDEDNKIYSLKIIDKIRIDTINFKEGNIGNTIICPVEIELINGINAGFVLNSAKNITAEYVDGGTVKTNESAILENIFHGSLVEAKDKVSTAKVNGATLIASHISINKELSSSKITAAKISLDEKQEKIVSNSNINAQIVKMDRCLMVGNNTITLGEKLFENIVNCEKEIQRLKKKIVQMREKSKYSQEKFSSSIKKLSNFISDEKIDDFKFFIGKIGNMTYEEFSKELQSFHDIQISLVIFKTSQVFKENRENNEKLNKLCNELAELEKILNDSRELILQTSMNIEGIIYPTAKIIICCGDKKYSYEASGTGKEKINISTSYEDKHGFSVKAQSPGILKRVT